MRRPAALAPLLLTLLAVAGCATGAGGNTRPDAPGSSAAAAGSSVAGAGATGCRSGQVTVTEAQSGQELCVTTGTLVQVYLHGQQGAAWSPVNSDGTALRAVASGKRALPLGVTAGFFQAVGAGTARVTAGRPVCPSAPPGSVKCMAMRDFSVTVEVR